MGSLTIPSARGHPHEEWVYEDNNHAKGPLLECPHGASLRFWFSAMFGSAPLPRLPDCRIAGLHPAKREHHQTTDSTRPTFQTVPRNRARSASSASTRIVSVSRAPGSWLGEHAAVRGYGAHGRSSAAGACGRSLGCPTTIDTQAGARDHGCCGRG